jgi:hypothetical protein
MLFSNIKQKHFLFQSHQLTLVILNLQYLFHSKQFTPHFLTLLLSSSEPEILKNPIKRDKNTGISCQFVKPVFMLSFRILNTNKQRSIAQVLNLQFWIDLNDSIGSISLYSGHQLESFFHLIPAIIDWIQNNAIQPDFLFLPFDGQIDELVILVALEGVVDVQVGQRVVLQVEELGGVDADRVAALVLQSVWGDVLHVVQDQRRFQKRVGVLEAEWVDLLKSLLERVQEIVGDVEIQNTFFLFQE